MNLINTKGIVPVNKYKAKVKYNEGIMESPWCTVEGEREVFAHNIDKARQAIVTEANFLGRYDVEIIEITELVF